MCTLSASIQIAHACMHACMWCASPRTQRRRQQQAGSWMPQSPSRTGCQARAMNAPCTHASAHGTSMYTPAACLPGNVSGSCREMSVVLAGKCQWFLFAGKCQWFLPRNVSGSCLPGNVSGSCAVGRRWIMSVGGFHKHERAHLCLQIPDLHLHTNVCVYVCIPTHKHTRMYEQNYRVNVCVCVCVCVLR
jgi:hypothetical protein